jgi:hypothetical protein
MSELMAYPHPPPPKSPFEMHAANRGLAAEVHTAVVLCVLRDARPHVVADAVRPEVREVSPPVVPPEQVDDPGLRVEAHLMPAARRRPVAALLPVYRMGGRGMDTSLNERAMSTGAVQLTRAWQTVRSQCRIHSFHPTTNHLRE